MKMELYSAQGLYSGLRPGMTPVYRASDVESMENECLALAANQCHFGYGGEGGHHRCKYQDRIAELETELKKSQEKEFALEIRLKVLQSEAKPSAVDEFLKLCRATIEDEAYERAAQLANSFDFGLDSQGGLVDDIRSLKNRRDHPYDPKCGCKHCY